MVDMNIVNNPPHYCQEGKKECIVEMEEKFGARAVIDFCLLNAYKYLYRRGVKEDNSYEQDTEKAKWYYNYAKKKMEEHNLNYNYILSQIDELLKGSM